MELILAGAGSRFAGGLIDLAALGGLLLLVLVVGGIVGGIAAAVVGEDSGGSAAGVVLALGLFAVFFGYHPFFEVRRAGRSPGKRRMGMRVVGIDGYPIGFVQSAVRNLLRLVDSLPGNYLVGLACIFFSRNHQRLGDLAAGTVVVMDPMGTPPRRWRKRRRKEKAAWETVDEDAALRVAGITPEDTARWDVSAIGNEELLVVRGFLRRRSELTVGARHQLGWRFAEGLRPKVAGPAADLESEALLEGIAAAKLARS